MEKEINRLVDTLKYNIKLLILRKIDYKNNIIEFMIKNRDILDQNQKNHLAEIIYSIHDELIYLKKIHKKLSKLYI